MMNEIHFTTEHPDDFNELVRIYEELGWNSLQLTVTDLEKMCKQSWYAVYAYEDYRLVGMGRVISDGVITAIICGLCVLPNYQSRGIGKELMKCIINHCEEHQVIPQLMCVEDLERYYEELGFKRFSIGMTKQRG
ncbi:GNAT family N-acetyltransferase [Sporosarcina sp. ACRSL]|uniref:GNAT family N-acetyltransferase n=1 Tax=Sporosarcina sp. ACRSL TaxID=2918215 RepID=UPI001EF6E197|nr:GNAT family N-acetyltransferase [Sporosarcina sp. ACRSL]MCG7346289.1 GNAT family N-acetyltransferase [Sporosarcina sp. ACRSL]